MELKYWTAILFLINGALCTDTTNCPHQLSRRDLYVYGDYCLKVHYGNWDWETARKICIKEGGDLVQPRTARMQEFIRVNLLPQKQKSEEDGFWIGATDLNSESHWRWVSGDPRMPYTNFEPGQGPSQSGFIFASGDLEDCALMRIEDGFRWHDCPCSNFLYHYSFICQHKKIPHTTHNVKPTTKHSHLTTTRFVSPTTKYVPPTTTKYMPPTTTKFEPQTYTSTRFVPWTEKTTRFDPQTDKTTRFDPQTEKTTRFVPWTERTTMLSERTRSSTAFVPDTHSPTSQKVTAAPPKTTPMKTDAPRPATTPELPSDTPPFSNGGGDPFSGGFKSFYSAPVIDHCSPHLGKSNVYTYGDLCLKVHYGNYDWDDARHSCHIEGGDLVQIRDASMQHFLHSILSGQKSEEDGFWIGATDRESESHWKWVAGDPKMTYSNWKSGQGPSQSGFFLSSGSFEDCALMRVDDGFRWHDYDCSNILYHYSFICQYAISQTTHAGGPNIGIPGSTTVFTPYTFPDTSPPATNAPVPTTPPETDAPIPTTPPETDAPLPTTPPKMVPSSKFLILCKMKSLRVEKGVPLLLGHQRKMQIG
ncbi:macrophage mannose receptor 1-like [Ostrea edulis]|uniref:macrophage mannose receptor 1-like n=1 Tax=Ostrea edulis TaxID=37623 RepID=UPI0024AF29E8|nr:macrophage mannose receptor 1-like [Ostrea edulis]